MASEIKKEIELEIAHVLFLDIVGYSKLSVNEQHARVDELNGIVRLSEQFQKAEGANRILKIPTGDGMAPYFRDRTLAQMLGYLNITGLDLALLLNFKNARLEWKRVLRPPRSWRTRDT